jgi:hypothetical protein
VQTFQNGVRPVSSNIIIPFPDGAWWHHLATADTTCVIKNAMRADVLVIGKSPMFGSPPTIRLGSAALEWMEITGLHGRYIGGKTRGMICFDDDFAAGIFRLAFKL